MTVTLSTFLQRIARDLHEDNSFPPGRNNLWTLDEMLGYINYAERDFLRLTGIIKEDTSVSVANGNEIAFLKPTACVDIERLSFNKKRLLRVTAWDLERENYNWRDNTVGNPSYYHEDHLPVSYFELNKVPAAGGTYRIFYTSMPREHKLLSDTIVVNDCWEPYIRWKVLSLALAKDGDNQDMQRSAYAQQRYLVGVSLAKRLMIG